jgi:hypothetical protein
MNSEYFVSTGSEEDDVKGPLNLQDVREAIARREILVDTQLTTTESGQWAQALAFPEIADIFEARRKADQVFRLERQKDKIPQTTLGGWLNGIAILNFLAACSGLLPMLTGDYIIGGMVVGSGFVSGLVFLALAAIINLLQEIAFRLRNIQALLFR